jgi:hypothetical protein
MDFLWKFEGMYFFCKFMDGLYHLPEPRPEFQNAKLCLSAYMKTSLTLFSPLQTYTSLEWMDECIRGGP